MDNNESFSPSWGAFVFDCRFCGAAGMQWLEKAPGKWVPYDLNHQIEHDCPEKNQPFTREQLLHYLNSLGFEAYIPRTSSWMLAFIASNKSQTIYFLIGKRSIDFKLYNQLRPTRTDEKGKLFTDGGTMVRNYYRESEKAINALAAEIAFRFLANIPLDDYLAGNGTSWKAMQDRENIPHYHHDREMSLREALAGCEDSEGRIYLCDGVYI